MEEVKARIRMSRQRQERLRARWHRKSRSADPPTGVARQRPNAASMLCHIRRSGNAAAVRMLALSVRL